jgi:hypothetical protein
MTYKAIGTFVHEGTTYNAGDVFTVPATWKVESLEQERSKTSLAISKVFYNQSGAVRNTVIVPVQTT